MCIEYPQGFQDQITRISEFVLRILGLGFGVQGCGFGDLKQKVAVVKTHTDPTRRLLAVNSNR